MSEDCVSSSATGATKLKIRDTKLDITLSTQDNENLLQQSGVKRTIDCNKYQRNQYVIKLFALLFENE